MVLCSRICSEGVLGQELILAKRFQTVSTAGGVAECLSTELAPQNQGQPVETTRISYVHTYGRVVPAFCLVCVACRAMGFYNLI